jgi:transcriptional regulator with XRE-family HTH domain
MSNDRHDAPMTTRQRPGDLGAEDARRQLQTAGREIRAARRALGISVAAAARRAGTSASQFGRIERSVLRRPSVDQVFRAARAVGLEPALRLHLVGARIRDKAQLGVLARFESLLAPPLRLRREVPVPLPGDLRAWDGRITDGMATASIEAESKLWDAQATERRIALKSRDDPDAGIVILVLNRTAHNRRVLAEHREALRSRFPLDGAAIARALRSGKLPPAGGIILV